MDTIVANRYASALFDLAIEENKIDEIKESLNDVTNAITLEKDFLKILKLPQVTKTDKRDMITTVFGGKIVTEVMNFLYVLIDKSRINQIVTINDEFNTLYNDYKRIVNADVYSAKPLTDQQLDSLKEVLSKKFDSEVIITNKIDETLIGGIRVEANNQIIDNSIYTKLSLLKDNLLNVNL